MDTRWTVCSYHFWSQYTVPCSDPSLLSILSQHIIIPEVSVLFVESRSFFSHISALLLSNFVATGVYALSLKISKSLPAVFFLSLFEPNSEFQSWCVLYFPLSLLTWNWAKKLKWIHCPAHNYWHITMHKLFVWLFSEVARNWTLDLRCHQTKGKHRQLL